MPQEQLFEDAAVVPGHVASTDLFGGTGAEAMERGADISPCRRYRYTLWRKWGPGGTCMFVGLNQSTADATLLTKLYTPSELCYTLKRRATANA